MTLAPVAPKLLSKPLLMALLSPLLAPGLHQMWDQVAQLRLEFPPYMVSYAAICAEGQTRHVRVLELICDQNKKGSARSLSKPN